MSAEILKAAFDPFFPAPVEAWQDFASYCETEEYPKDYILKASDQSAQYFYFLVKGSAGIFLWRENNFVCLDFAFENHFFGDYMSILTGQPTPIMVSTLEPCTVLRIKRADYLALGETPIGSTLMRAAAESTYILKQQQQIDLLTKTAEQRYHELVEHQPWIVQRIAQKHLASYLGITPQSLSRIRKK
jgi:CRP-like cAMP-binding protein